MKTIEAMSKVDQIWQQLQRACADLKMEIDDISIQWENLGAIGSQREDHAASLLATLLPHLSGLQSKAKTIESQICGIVADPFERN